MLRLGRRLDGFVTEIGIRNVLQPQIFDFAGDLFGAPAALFDGLWGLDQLDDGRYFPLAGLPVPAADDLVEHLLRVDLSLQQLDDLLEFRLRLGTMGFELAIQRVQFRVAELARPLPLLRGKARGNLRDARRIRHGLLPEAFAQIVGK